MFIFIAVLDHGLRFPDFPVLVTDSEEYLQLAKNIIDEGVFSLSTEEPFVPESFRSPGYPLFIAAILIFFSDPIFVSLVQVILYALTVALIYKLTEHFLGKRAGVVTAGLATINISAINSSFILHSDTLAVFLLIASLYLFLVVSYKNNFAFKYMFMSGLVLGFAILVRPIMQYVPVLFVGAYFVFYIKGSRTKTFGPFLIFLVGVVLVVSPWMIRNHNHYDTFQISSIVGYNLLYYNAGLHYGYENGVQSNILGGVEISNPSIFENSEIYAPYKSIITEAHPTNYLQEGYHEKRSFKYSGHYMAVAREYIFNNFLSYSKYHIIKMSSFFFGNSFRYTFVISTTPEILNSYNFSTLIAGREAYEIRNGLFNGLLKRDIVAMSFVFNFFVWTIFYMVALCAIISIFLNKDRDGRAMFFVIFSVVLVVYFAILTGPASSLPRYRLPAEPFIFALVGAGSVFIYDFFKAKRSKK